MQQLRGIRVYNPGYVVYSIYDRMLLLFLELRGHILYYAKSMAKLMHALFSEGVYKPLVVCAGSLTIDLRPSSRNARMSGTRFDSVCSFLSLYHSDSVSLSLSTQFNSCSTIQRLGSPRTNVSGKIPVGLSSIVLYSPSLSLSPLYTVHLLILPYRVLPEPMSVARFQSISPLLSFPLSLYHRSLSLYSVHLLILTWWLGAPRIPLLLFI